MRNKRDPNALEEVHTRLFEEDIAELKKIAETTGTKWQVELRLLVRRALRGEIREVRVLTERTS